MITQCNYCDSYFASSPTLILRKATEGTGVRSMFDDYVMLRNHNKFTSWWEGLKKRYPVAITCHIYNTIQINKNEKFDFCPGQMSVYFAHNEVLFIDVCINVLDVEESTLNLHVAFKQINNVNPKKT